MQTVITYYKNLTRWDVKYFASNLLFGDNLVTLKEFLVPKAEKIKKDDYTGDFDVVAKITFSDGVVHFRKERQTGMDLFKGKEGDLLTSKINIHQGAVAICPQDLVCSTHYHIYQVNTDKIIPEYLILALRSGSFLQKIMKLKASSIKNEIGPKVFLDFKIYAPLKKEQQKIVDYWQSMQKEAQELNKKADEKEKAIDDYILSALGIEKKEYKKRDGTFIVRFKDLERWDTYFYREDFFMLNAQFEKIKHGKLGDKAFFVSRPWSKKDFLSGDFHYVQISDVNKQDGINNFENVAVNDAPSRATQIIKEEDIIISTTRPYLAAFAKVGNKFNGCVASSGFSVIEKTTDDLDKNYLLEFLKSYAGLKQFEQRMTGASYPAVTQDELEKIKIPLPPLTKQKEIAKKIEAIHIEIAEIKNRASRVLETTQKEICKMLKT